MADEYFWGVTLKGENASEIWDPEGKLDASVDNEYPRANKLILKQILLGVEAKADEYNVVEVEAITHNDKQIKIPIAVLKVGEQRSSQSFLEFPDGPVTFKLIQGTGPVYIHGHHILGEYDTDEMEELDIEEEEADDADSDNEEEEDGEAPKKKLKLSNNSKPGSKNSKTSKKK